jgi:hypothetical protein
LLRFATNTASFVNDFGRDKPSDAAPAQFGLLRSSVSRISLQNTASKKQKKADATEHQRCSIASAYSLTGAPAVSRITLYLVFRDR